MTESVDSNSVSTKPVFISYSTDDSAAAEQIRDGLEAASLSCWMAPRDIAPGLDYGTQIIDAIGACTVLVLVLSESSNYSIYVRKEVERAIAKGKVVIPVRIQEVTASRSLEFFIADAQWIDAWDSLLAMAIVALHRAVSGHLTNRGAEVNAPTAPAPRPSHASELLPSPTHSPSPTHQPPVERVLFVGREAQMAELEAALAQSLSGHGQLRFVTGEAGAGKSALLNEFQFRAREQDAQLLIASGACDAQTGISDPYLPFREILTALARQDGGRAALLEHGPDLVDTLIPGTALGSHRSGPGRATDAKPVEQSQIFEQAVQVLQTVAQRTPLLLILEDMHWVDEASIGLLFRLGRQLEGSRILVLGTYRSEEVSLGRDGETHPLQKSVNELRRILGSIHIDLDAVRETEGMALVDALLDAESNQLDASFRQALYEHTGGHPLFVVELLRDLQSDGGLVRDTDGRWRVSPSLSWSALPDRVEGIIAVRMARLDDEERQLLTTASVLGEHFIAEAVAQALKINPRHVALRLSGSLQKQHKLVEAEARERVGRQRLTRYRFRHNLMQVYLYEQLDDVERSFLHEDIGYVLEEMYGNNVNEFAVQLAHHFQAAGVEEKALDYLIVAAERAARSAAYVEAAELYGQASALLDELAENAADLERAFSIHFALGEALRVIHGVGTDEETVAFNQALGLARQLENPLKVAQTLYALAWGAQMRGEFELAARYGEESQRLAAEGHDLELEMKASQILGGNALFLGNYADAVSHAELVVSFYRTQRPVVTHDDAGNFSWALAQLGSYLLPAGYPDRALRLGEESNDLARGHDDDFGGLVSLTMLSWTYLHRGDWPLVIEVSDQILDTIKRLGDVPQLRHMVEAIRGAAMTVMGDAEEGIALVRRALAERVQYMHAGVPGHWAELAAACGRIGRVLEGLELMEEAFIELEISGDHEDEAKIYQIQGDLLLLQEVADEQMADVQQEAEVCFHHAIKVAREGGAKLWEARTLASLCRLLESQGRVEEWHQQIGELRELYAWFTEGFETEDLRFVKEVLDAGETQTA